MAIQKKKKDLLVSEFLRYNLKVAPIVYQLIGATLKGNFFDDIFFK